MEKVKEEMELVEGRFRWRTPSERELKKLGRKKVVVMVSPEEIGRWERDMGMSLAELSDAEYEKVIAGMKTESMNIY